MHTHRRVAWLAAAAAALALAAPATALAGGKKASYYYEVFNVKLVEGIPARVQPMVAKQLAERITAHERIADTLPEGAPDRDKEPKKFVKWLERNKLRAFKVNVEVLSYKHELAPMPDGRKGKRLTVSIDLRAFGETIPGRVMAFTGEGSATIMIEVGNKPRKRDHEIGDHDAIELALDKALAESIRKLDTAEAENKKKKKTRKK